MQSSNFAHCQIIGDYIRMIKHMQKPLQSFLVGIIHRKFILPGCMAITTIQHAKFIYGLVGSFVTKKGLKLQDVLLIG